MKVVIKVLRKYCCAIVIIAFACGCGGPSSESVSVETELPKKKYYRKDIGCAIYTTEIEGHLYIVMSRGYGVSIIHAEHCPCKNSRE